MALSAAALTTLEKAELFIARTGTQGSAVQEADDDTFLELLIESFSAAIPRYIARELKPQVTATRRFRYDGTGYLSLAPYDLRSASAITFGSDLVTSSQVLLAAQTASAESDYRLEPRQLSSLGTYTRLVLSTTFSRWGYGKRGEVSITGDWGAVQPLPPDIEYACLIAVRDAYLSGTPQAPASDEFAAAEPSGPSSLPPSTRALLAPYLR